MRALVVVLGPLIALVGFAGCELAYPTHEAEGASGDAADTSELRDAGDTSDARDARTDGDGDTSVVIPGKCKPPGLYCGNDKIPGDPNVLYKCVADADAVVSERCEAGCEVAPPGFDDDCVR